MALPIFASMLLGTVVSKVVPQFAMKKLGMDPTQAALLGAAAGFGLGAYDAGAFGSSAANVTGSTFGAGSPWAGGSTSLAKPNLFSSGSPWGSGTATVGSAVSTPSAASIFNPPTNLPGMMAGASTADILGMKAAYNGLGTYAEASQPTTWGKLKEYATSDDSQRFLGNAASTLIEGLMQEKPRRPMLSGGGGGGGGGMAPAYGGGGGGQVGVTWGFGGQQGGYRPQPIT